MQAQLGCPLLPLTLAATWPSDVVQSAHDPVHAVLAALRSPCAAAR